MKRATARYNQWSTNSTLTSAVLLFCYFLTDKQKDRQTNKQMSASQSVKQLINQYTNKSIYYTSNVTSVSEVQSTSTRCLPVRGAPWWVLLQHSIRLQLFFIIECGIISLLCAMHAFKVRASSSSPRLCLGQNFISFAASIAELAHGEKLRTYLNNSSKKTPNLSKRN